MTITSLPFLTFVLMVVGLHALLPATARPAFLLLASYAFYATWSPRLVLLLAGLTLADFALVAGMRAAPTARRVFLWIGILLNGGAILVLRHGQEFGVAGVVGLSFYGLQGIAFLVDSCTGALRLRPTLLEVAVYLSYFPKLLAGPLERAFPFVSTLRDPRPIDPGAVGRAITLIAIGSIRKVVIADHLRLLLPEGVFATPGSFPSGTLALSALILVLFIYNDFAGYTDLARGLSLCLGIPLTMNFAQPLFAADFVEFWTRWHASLSLWLRDYVYLPVSRALLRRGWRPRSVANLVGPPMMAMAVSALWHGVRGGMMLWGALQGSYLIVGRVTASRRPRRTSARPAWRRVIGSATVIVLVAIAFVAARAGFASSVAFWTAVVGNGGWTLPGTWPCLLVALSFMIDTIQYRAGDEVVFLRWPRPLRAALLAGTIVACTLAGASGSPQGFVYQGF